MTFEESKNALEQGLLVDYMSYYHGKFKRRKIQQMVYRIWQNGDAAWRLFLVNPLNDKDVVVAAPEDCIFSKAVDK